MNSSLIITKNHKGGPHKLLGLCKGALLDCSSYSESFVKKINRNINIIKKFFYSSSVVCNGCTYNISAIFKPKINPFRVIELTLFSKTVGNHQSLAGVLTQVH